MISDDNRDNKIKINKNDFKVDPMLVIENFCVNQDILYVDSLKLLKSRRNEMLQKSLDYNPMYIEITDDYCHPNSYGYEVIADAVFNAISPIFLEMSYLALN